MGHQELRLCGWLACSGGVAGFYVQGAGKKVKDSIITCGIGRGRVLTDEETRLYQEEPPMNALAQARLAYVHNRISVPIDSLQAGFVFRQPEPWLVIGAPGSGAAFKFDEEEMRRRLADGFGKNGVEAREYQMMTAIAAVLDYEREKATRINKTEL